MLAALLVIAVTASLAILGRAGISRLDEERKSLKPPSRPPLVSIVIPAYMSEKTIAKTLESVKESTYPRKEIIVVNDSRDKTPEIAKKHGARVIQNRERTGKARALNIATTKAKGSLILMLDADTTISRDCISRLVPWFSSRGVVAAMPRYSPASQRTASRMAGIENAISFSLLRVHMLLGSLAGFRGCCVMMRRDVLRKHPWPETILEDNHLAATLAKKGHRMMWEPLAEAYTDEPEEESKLREQKRRWGEGAYLAFRHHTGFYLRSPQFITFIYPYILLGAVGAMLLMGLVLSPLLFPWLFFPILTELALFMLAMYLNIVVFMRIGSGHASLPDAARFMLIYSPMISGSYIKGVAQGIKTKRKGMPELHFRNW